MIILKNKVWDFKIKILSLILIKFEINILFIHIITLNHTRFLWFLQIIETLFKLFNSYYSEFKIMWLLKKMKEVYYMMFKM